MKATGIVRRIGVKNGFWAVFIHSKSEVNSPRFFVITRGNAKIIFKRTAKNVNR